MSTVTRQRDARKSVDVNNFEAIRIGLASPEAIRSWSYGEVTKPETINYRTLKPEHGGLFCERIFGPTKDFECYCGKYKRQRYAGTICDKCGVEVTRSKVRRERMGHIELAAPVAHIWYVKGTPSRLGILLDITPRNLERVLYFASYLVTRVDEAKRQELIENIRQELQAELEELDRQLETRRRELEEAQGAELVALRERRSALEREALERAASARERVRRQAAEVREQLQHLLGQEAEADLTFAGRLIVGAGERVTEAHLSALDEAEQEAVEEAERTGRSTVTGEQALVEAEQDLLVARLTEQLASFQNEIERQKADLRAEADELIRQVQEIHELQVLTEQQYRELMDIASGVFEAKMGAEAVYEVVSRMDLDQLSAQLRAEMAQATGQRQKRIAKRLRLVEALRKSGNRPEWMLLTVLPVIPPDLRPMVQLDGGRFATSDLNDLYRRVINRNNRLKRLIELGAPDIIIRNEKRMLQEAVDALIDNGRRGRVVSGTSKHKLKSLSDMLKGKQGRFRQNLLGKRVDYSGRSVIVVGPDLKLHQCGLPKRMALELFKPFVMQRLVVHGHAHNIKAAKRLVERMDPRVWDVLEEVTQNYLVLLNRAPTLHRLGIQAFEVKLIEGSAIQLHPLVCAAFNADFDGDQMAVHVPLSAAAQREARERMLSTRNLLDPSDGEPVIAPTLDIVLGCYVMTLPNPEAKGAGKVFANRDEVVLAYQSGAVDLQAPIRLRMEVDASGPELVETTVGRVLFNEILPKELGFWNELMDRKALRRLIAECYQRLGPDETARLADRIKDLGFHYATKSGITIGVTDVHIPPEKAEIIARADQRVAEVERQYRRGLITDAERHREVVAIWNEARDELAQVVERSLGEQNSLYMMSKSGAKGNINQINQMAGMRGLMLDPKGQIIELPIRSNFREGLSVLEYFISTHGARKGLADTALRTADSGYLTRRLVDVAQDVIVTIDDCGTEDGMWIRLEDLPDRETYADRILGRVAARDLIDPATGELLVRRNEELTEPIVAQIIASLERSDPAQRITAVMIRTPLYCTADYGVCRLCYGRNLATRQIVELGEAVGIIAAQSIGEPGTQLTMRTFHTGGVAGEDITTGLPRVEELFEAREPKGKAILAKIDGVVQIVEDEYGRKVVVHDDRLETETHRVPEGYVLLVGTGELVAAGQVLAQPAEGQEGEPIVATLDGEVFVDGNEVVIRREEQRREEYQIPAAAHLLVSDGDRVTAGQPLTDGNASPEELLSTLGRDVVQRYILDEVQKVYKSQGVVTNDRHIEIIIRQMLRKVAVTDPGDTDLLVGEMLDRTQLLRINEEVIAQGGVPATAQQVLLGITKASLATESWLSAASFQETTRVLTEAAIQGKVDYLRGLKENVIIGKLIPAGSGFWERKRRREAALSALDEVTLAGLAAVGLGPGGEPLPGLAQSAEAGGQPGNPDEAADSKASA
ncbi:DNA-directed RNA polymerase subunit beta' [Thermomicrobium sp. CFH 73360]|uniref:DNA-directed RNA polymerase subunit beta' n=1 Tax=Thermomicrobium sp. CFH 73360 TaxID=2951987 RepID=UPI0020778D8A|nr:DNA-directed RNA polymerase subunit beta' [Thermomicrobium sp. CFH 73360]MCM8747454.1 DNA-directed RNA polymerase subunit beta' [Thermomicrobium sp. CFH 73360]